MEACFEAGANTAPLDEEFLAVRHVETQQTAMRAPAESKSRRWPPKRSIVLA